VALALSLTPALAKILPPGMNLNSLINLYTSLYNIYLISGSVYTSDAARDTRLNESSIHVSSGAL